MAPKHSILRQPESGNDLFIDLYYSERPEHLFSDSPDENNSALYKAELNNWLSHPDKTVKVDEGSKEKFELLFGKYLTSNGIEIELDVFEVKKFGKFYAGNYMNKCIECNKTFMGCDKRQFICEDCCNKEFAFFKEPKEEEDLWPTDEDCIEIAYDFGYGFDPPRGNKKQEEIHEAAVWGLKKLRDYLKQNFEIKRRKG